jgi:hypothetical protein
MRFNVHGRNQRITAWFQAIWLFHFWRRVSRLGEMPVIASDFGASRCPALELPAYDLNIFAKACRAASPVHAGASTMPRADGPFSTASETMGRKVYGCFR